MNDQLYSLCESVVDESLPSISSISNILAVLYHELKQINWAGIYLYNPYTKDLVLGPFQGKPACTKIPFEKGVVGTCAAAQKTIVVDDVNAFPGHIACDCASRSEICVPLIQESKLLGILDIDSDQYSNFDETVSSSISRVAGLLARALFKDRMNIFSSFKMLE